MRTFVTALITCQLMAGFLLNSNQLLAADSAGTSTAEQEGFQLGQRVVIDRDVHVDVEGGPSIHLRRGTVHSILALDGGRAQVCDVAPVWIEQSDLLSLRDAKVKLTGELKENRDDVELLVAVGDFYRGLGVHDLAVEAYCRALEHDDDNFAAIRGRAESYYFALREGPCLDGLKCALKDRPDDARSHYLHGYVLICHEQWDRSLASLDAAIKSAPQYVQAWTARAEAKWRSGDIDGAMADYEEAMRLGENATAPYVGRAKYYLEIKKYDEAAADLEKALEINPRDHQAHEVMARVILATLKKSDADDEEKREQIARALDHARKASDLSGGQKSGYSCTLSRAYLAAGDNSRAVEWRTHAVRLVLAREHYYRNWQLEHTFRHGKPEQVDDDVEDHARKPADENGV